jgi:hypothetical protein
VRVYGGSILISGYTPFSAKALSELSATDLDTLSTVSEGWYVEYKRQLPNSKAIAKAISSFANTYGGWLFVGVEESGKSGNVAASCPGILRSEMDSALQIIRQSAASQLNPTPHFEVQVVHGPNEKMQLPEERCVICIQVPQSMLAPHVHSSGVIYRRVSDSSEPQPENDRHQLDLLWTRRDKIHENYRQWIERSPERSEGESRSPYLRILLEADLYGAKGKLWDLSIDDIQEVFNDRSSGPVITLENIYPSSRGIVARQTSSLTSHEQFGFTWIVGRGLRCEIWLPLSVHTVDEPHHLFAQLGRYELIERFVKQLEESKAKNSRILDLNQVFLLLVSISNMYLKLLAKCGATSENLHAKVILSEVWRTIPFFDSKVMLDRADRYGVPLCLESEAMVPGGSDAESFFKMNVIGEDIEESIRCYSYAFWMFELTCRALGIQGVLNDCAATEGLELYHELESAWDKARSKEGKNSAET